MNTLPEPTLPGKNVSEKRTPYFLWFTVIICSLFLGLWAGHQFWPEPVPKVVNPPKSVISQPLRLPEAGGQALGVNTIADIAQAVAPAVVNIDTRTSISLSNTPMHFGLPFGDFQFYMGPGRRNHDPFGEFFGEGPIPRKFEQSGSGSGLIIRSDGYILTNNHVVRNATDIKVRLNDKRVFAGRVVGRDSFTDLALVKIDAQGLPVAALGTSKTIRPGDWAIAIGSPLGLDHTVTLGIVSALGRSLSDLNNNVELIQTDAAINPGNSGGPLLNIKGEVIGINTAIRNDAQNIGFAIPVDVCKNVVYDLLSHGTISRPYLGIMMQKLEPNLAESLSVPRSTQGVVVAQIVPDSPAAKSELSPGDIIQRIDGKTVSSSQDVQTIVRSRRVGDTLNFLILRQGRLASVSVKIGEYPQSENSD